MRLEARQVSDLRAKARRDLEAYSRDVFSPYLDEVALLHAIGVYNDQTAANAIRDMFGMNCMFNGVASQS